MLVKAFAIFVLYIASSQALWAYPWHASCKIKYTFEKPCSEVLDAIANQMVKWKGTSNCECKCHQKCLYNLDSRTTNKITGRHETPVKHYIDLLTMDFKQNGNICNVEAFSESKLWYAILDFGTNYCNLHNLVEGAGLHLTPGYKEETKNAVCTQYTSANCEKY